MCSYIKKRPCQRKKLAVCPAHVKEIALDYAKSIGLPHTRFSEKKFLAAIERITVDAIKARVKYSQRRSGRTLL